MASSTAMSVAPVFTGLRASKVQQKTKAVAVAKAPVAAQASLQNVAKAAALGAVASAASLALAFPSLAVTIKMGSDNGSLVFEPSSVTVKAGETITWQNNVGFPHNVVFDEDEVPAGVNVDALSHEDYANAPGETFSVKLDKAGTYEYYCEPHRGAGMKGQITVQ
eukprot:jgi/Chlat1/320/Chrsp1S03187